MRRTRRSYPSNIHKKLIGFTAIGQCRASDGHWIMLYAWAFTAEGARRRLDRMMAETMWKEHYE